MQSILLISAMLALAALSYGCDGEPYPAGEAPYPAGAAPVGKAPDAGAKARPAQAAPEPTVPEAPAETTVVPDEPGEALATITLPPLNDAGRDADAQARRTQIGVHRDIPQPLPDAAAWVVEDGRPVWRIRVRSPDAFALRLHFTELRTGGGEVRVFEADEAVRREQPRIYRERGPAGDGDLWSDVLEGDTAVVEYRPAPGDAAAGPPPFRLLELSHLWTSPF